MATMDCSKSCAAKALRRRGLQWWRWRQRHREEAEKDTWAGPRPTRSKICRWEDTVSAEISKVCGKNLHNNRQDGYTLLGIVGCVVSLGDLENCRLRVVERGDESWLRVATSGCGWRVATNGGSIRRASLRQVPWALVCSGYEWTHGG